MTELFGMLLTFLVAVPFLATTQVDNPPKDAPPADPATTPGGGDPPSGGDTPEGGGDPAKGDPDKPTEPEKATVTIGAEELRTMQQAQAEYKGLREKYDRLKGVAGRQSKEIETGKATKAADADQDEPPAPRTRRRPAAFKPDEEGMVVYNGRRMELEHAEELRDRDERLRGVEGRLDAEDERRKDAESAQLAQDERTATIEVRKAVADVGVQSVMAVLKIEDEDTASVAEFMADAMLHAVAAECKTPLETMDQNGLTAILNDEVIPAIERVLSFRHREQDTDNDEYRRLHPAKTGGAPALPKGMTMTDFLALPLTKRQEALTKMAAQYKE